MVLAPTFPRLGSLPGEEAENQTWTGDVVHNEPDASRRLVRVFSFFVVAMSVAIPIMNVISYANYAHQLSNFAPANLIASYVVAVALYLPMHVRLVWGALWEKPVTHARGLLAAMAVIVFGALPVVGAPWMRMFVPFAFVVLLVLRPPWSVLALVGLAIAPFLVAWVWGERPQYAASTSLGVGSAAGLYSLAWMAETIRRLQSTRAALASEAVLMERLRIDDELRRTVGADLAEIIAKGERASASFGEDTGVTERQVGDLVGGSRQTLARARRMIRGFRRTSLRSELDTMTTLLRAGGIDARITLPRGLPETVEDDVRSMLRAATGRLLRDGSVRQCVIVVSSQDGRVSLDVSSEAGAA